MEFTGERFVPDYDAPELAYEHWHRYLYASQFVSGKSVLDVACGEGYGTNWLARGAERVVGVDVAAAAVQHASATYRRPNLEFLCGPAQSIPVPGNGIFDVVTSFETIEHLNEAEQRLFLNEVTRLLKLDGIFIVSTPNRLLYSDMPKYVNEFHKKEFYVSEFEAFLKEFFPTICILGQHTYPVSYLWAPGNAARELAEFQIAHAHGEFQPIPGDGKQLLYMIAICSHGPVTSPKNSVMLDLLERATADRQARIGRLAQNAQNLNVSLAERTAAEAQLRSEMQAARDAAESNQVQMAQEVARREAAELRCADLTTRLKDRTEFAARDQRLDAIERVQSRHFGEIRGEFRRLEQRLIDFQEQVLDQQDQLRSAVFDLQFARAAPAASDGSGKVSEYLDLLARIRETALGLLPRGAKLAVISKGDGRLLRFPGRAAWHFPQDLQGTYAGNYPAHSISAIAQLEAMRVCGADFFLVPDPCLWWLDHYAAFAEHLNRRYRALEGSGDSCRIFDLRETAAGPNSSRPAGLAEVLEECRDRLGREPAVLDWSTQTNLAKALPGQTVFSPPAGGRTLPYLDRSVDVVAVPADSTFRDEAFRVAGAAVITLDNGQDNVAGSPPLSVEWQAADPAEKLPSTSIFIAAREGGPLLPRRLQALRHSLPRGFRGDIILSAACQFSDRQVADIEAIARRWSDTGAVLNLALGENSAGYAAVCNRAAASQAGDCFVFMDEDTVAFDEWLPPFFRILREHSMAVVGGRVMLADGRLGEAGGVIFADGSLAGFGGGDYQAEHPLYGYVRETGYSGAVLAVSRAMFDQLEGFDNAFRTAAYSHADFCLRARDRGWQTYYQPQSVLLSLAGLGAASPLAAGEVRATQAIGDAAADRRGFFEKWADALRGQPFPSHWNDRDTWSALAARRAPDWEAVP